MRATRSPQSLTRPTIAAALAVLTLLAPELRADTTVSTTTASPSPSGTPVSCSQLCGILVDPSGNVLNIGGSAGWSSSDDQWCSNHGQMTNSAYPPQPTAMPAANPNSSSCNAVLLQGDTSCAQVNQNLQQCLWHGSQLETQCIAYATDKAAPTSEKIVLALDIAAAGTCAAACFATTMTPLQAACDGAAIGASAEEILQTMKQQSSAMSKMIDEIGGGLGLGLGAAGAVKLATGKGKQGKMACFTAAAMAAMSGLRYASIHKQDTAQANACGTIQSLASNAPTANTAANPPNAAALVAAYNNGTSGSAGSTASANQVTPAGTSLQGLNCVAQSGLTNCPVASAATASPDGQMLSSSGLDQALAPAAQQAAAALGNQSGAGSAVSGGMPGGAGSFGQALGQLAQAAQDHASELGMLGNVPAAVMTAGGGGGGGGGGGAKGDSDPFAGLLQHTGGDAFGSMAGGSNVQVFNNGKIADIWHTGTDQNIFQIVSDRIGKASFRLR